MICDALAPGGCSTGVCDDCCSPVMHFEVNASHAEALCAACVEKLCEHYDCADPAGVCSPQCVSHCWSELGSAPCLSDCVSCRGLWLAVAVAVPFLGRFGVDFLKGKVMEKLRPWLARHFDCCKPRGPDGAALLDGFSAGAAAPAGPPARFTMYKLTRGESSWARAVELQGLSPFGAVAQGLGRFLFWHLAQPASYFFVYGCAVQAGELDGLQLWLGGFVAGREALYTLMVLACTCVNPAFLLVDVGATVRDGGGFGGYTFLFMYVVAPEKFVAFALFQILLTPRATVGAVVGQTFLHLHLLRIVFHCGSPTSWRRPSPSLTSRAFTR